MPQVGVLNASLMPVFSRFLSVTSGQSVSLDFMLDRSASYRWPNRVNKASAGSVSPIGDVLSQTAKSKSHATYERVLDTLREIDYMRHQEEDERRSASFVPLNFVNPNCLEAE